MINNNNKYIVFVCMFLKVGYGNRLEYNRLEYLR